MNHQQILLVNLAKGKIGEDKANLLGSVLVTKLYLAALGAASYPRRKSQGLLFIHRRISKLFDGCFPVHIVGSSEVSA